MVAGQEVRAFSFASCHATIGEGIAGSRGGRNIVLIPWWKCSELYNDPYFHLDSHMSLVLVCGSRVTYHG